MKIIKIILLVTITINIVACTNKNLSKSGDVNQIQLEELTKLMTGTFSSRDQAASDSLFYNINLVMHPIWESDKTAKWLYVEQAVTRMLDKPYRQRVYKVSNAANGSIESKVFELPDPARFVHGWNNMELFKNITPDSLILRPGCAVYLMRNSSNCYSGTTNQKECKSTLRGASYATSIVDICKDQVTSWDQGWNAEDEQVWGAEVSGYIFKRIN